ncbi:NAD(+) synthase [Adlercreutzia sp. ZJ154]|uniref:NAD(+) synthase n=1 Tax=Adlercreutzia sp. ZJ154 TaxID=2709790 RepID=UPI0013ECAF4F|nr:NAD(+) synthase [Adlercreutzia sp. ZJ154]
MQIADIYEACKDATASFVHNAGFTHVVIGLSGGIDSSLVAAIAADALGANNVHGVLLPGPYSSDHSVSDAKQLSENLAIDAITIPIIEPYNAFAKNISDATASPFDGLASENTQARCRTVVLMALSNMYGWLMLNTGNKSEAAMGYSTLYGDAAGAFAPIGGIYKTQVYQMCEWRNKQALDAGEIAPIPRNVIEKPPSAELSVGQLDEKALGIDYKTLDTILIELVEHNADVQSVVNMGFSKARVQNILQRFEANAFKRAMEPPYPSVQFYE